MLYPLSYGGWSCKGAGHSLSGCSAGGLPGGLTPKLTPKPPRSSSNTRAASRWIVGVTWL